MTIEEGNKLIAEFCSKPYDKNHLWFKGKEGILKYHKSWDWLMPVVEKIESLWISGAQPRCTIRGNFVEIVHEVGYHNIDYAKNSDLKKDNQIGGACYTNNYSKIENTCRMVVEFIKWYNENKTT
jgi:hypothetical protein